MFEPTHLYSRLVENLPPLPWQSGDPNVKGDPRKSVKWIDVLPSAHIHILKYTNKVGPPRNRLLPRRPHPPRPRLGLRPLLPPRHRRRSTPPPPMAHPPPPLAGPHRSDHFRLSHRLCLRPQTPQTIPQRRHTGQFHLHREERLPATPATHLSCYHSDGDILDTRAVRRLSYCAEIRLLVVSVCSAKGEGDALGGGD